MEVNDNQVVGRLLASSEVAGFTVKPWTLKQLMQVLPLINQVVETLAKSGVTLDNLGEYLEREGLQGFTNLINLILPRLPEFLSISLRIQREEADEIDSGLALQLAVNIVGLNIEHLKNSFSLVMGLNLPRTGLDATH